jgi:tetratricopeptide (TPR) repeat protein
MEKMNQSNYDDARGYQTEVSGGIVNIGDHYHNSPQTSTTIPRDVRQGSPNFVGRKQDLKNLHEALQSEGKVSVCAVRGMGGVGKTELAIQYALSEEFQQSYLACYWFSLNQGDLATQILLKASPYLAMPEALQKSGSVEAQVKWCWQNWHPSTGNILVIIDDVKNLADIPPALMPIAARFKVMVTTRQRNLSPSFRELSLGILSEAESLELFTKIVDAQESSRIKNERETTKAICKYLGYLPLALELVANYLKDDQMLSLEDYLQQLHLEDESLADEMVRGITAEKGVIAAFNLSWQRLQGLATQLAMLLGRFATAAIPWQDLVEPTLNSLGYEKQAVKEARKQLANLSLIEIEDGKNIVIHALLREYFRYQSKQEGDDFIHTLQEAIASSGITIAKTIPYTLVLADIERVGLAIPHLELLSQRMLDDIPNPDEDLFWAFNGLAWFYQGQAQYNLAERYKKNCLEAVQSRLGENHPDVATSLNNLAALYDSQGRYESAEPRYLQALELRQRLLGENHPDVATSLNNLAELYRSQGRYEEAEPLFLQALELRKQLLGENHPDVAQSLNNLAALYYSQGRYESAKTLYLQALELRQRLLGENHPYVATSLNNLAGLYYSQGRYEDAEPLFLQALELGKQLLGENHPYVASSLNNLALLYKSQGRYEDAEPLYLQALELCKRLLGENHPDVASSLNNLAAFYRSQGRYEDAELLFLQALELRKQLLGENHPDVAQSLNNLAELYRSQGRYEDAEPLYLQALELCKQLLGENHPYVASSLNNLAALYYSQGRYEDAEPLYLQALELRKRLLGENHPYVASSLNNLAALYYSQGRYEDAEPLYLQALELRQRLLGENHPDVATSLNNLAIFYETQGKYNEAENLAQQALTICQAVLGTQHPHTLKSLFGVKLLQVMNLLQCDKQTLISILQAIAQQAELPQLNNESALMLLDLITTDSELLQNIRLSLHSDKMPTKRQKPKPSLLTWLQRIVIILLTPFAWLFRLIRWLMRRFIR